MDDLLNLSPAKLSAIRYILLSQLCIYSVYCFIGKSNIQQLYYIEMLIHSLIICMFVKRTMYVAIHKIIYILCSYSIYVCIH